MVHFCREIEGIETDLKDYVDAITSHIRLAILDTALTIVWVSHPLCQLLKYKKEELIGRPVSDVCVLPENSLELLTQCSKWSGEVESRAKNGDVIWFKSNVLPIRNSSGDIASYLVINSNITTTKQALEEKQHALVRLQKSEARYRALIENQADPISLCDGNGNRLFVNSSYCRLFGKSFHELVGTSIQALPFPGIPDSLVQQVLHLCPEMPQINGVFPVRKGSRETLWVDLSIKGIFGTDGTLEEILTIGREVTKLKNAELQKTNYIHDLERIAFMTSHNVRAPIATMLGLIELLRMDAIDKDKWQAVLDAFKKCVNGLDTCTREMSDFIYQRQRTETQNMP